MVLLVLPWSLGTEQAVSAVGRAQCPFPVLSCSRNVMCTWLRLPCSLSADIVSRALALCLLKPGLVIACTVLAHGY